MTQIDPGFGGVSKLVGLVWVCVLIGGIMALRSQPPLNPVRAAFRRRTALGAVVIAGIGLAQMLVRWLETVIGTAGDDTIPALDFRLWSYLILLAGIGYMIYTFTYMRRRYPQEVAASRQVRVVKQSQQRRIQTSTSGVGERLEPVEPRPVATTTRREARRERKKRKS